MRDRLTSQPGEWIERSRTIRFRFENAEYAAYEGDTISSALWANGVRMLGRSFKYHRPRGVMSMANHDVNCVVADGTQTNIRGDVTPARDGETYFAVNTQGGLKSDKGRFFEWLSPFMPVGFYYKAFHSPKKLFPFWEKQFRQAAGLGAINPNNPMPKTPKSYDFRDVTIVGAGPAGLSAAIAAGRSGAKVLVVDENPKPGGTLTYQFGEQGRTRLNEMLATIASMPNVEIQTRTQAAGAYADLWIALVNPQRLVKLRTRSLIVATGCFETPSVFENNDLPGVMLASAAQRLISRYAVKPFHRVVVLAANSEAYRAAADFKAAGINVAAIVDLRSSSNSVVPSGVRVIHGHAIHEAIPGDGKQSIKAALVCPLTSDGKLDATRGQRIDCDGIAMSVGWMPQQSLINQSGGKMQYDEAREQFVPNHLPPGLFAAGRINGAYDLDAQIEDGSRAGGEAAAFSPSPLEGEGRGEGYGSSTDTRTPHPNPLPQGERGLNTEPHSHRYPIFEHPHGKNFVDFDEDLKLRDFPDAVQEGFDSIELVKRYATVGMGPSQGKLANMNAVRVLAKIQGKSINETGTTTARPFFHPVPISHLSGRGFHPHRITAMHHRHEKAGAVFMPAGAWLRPAYYDRANGLSRSEFIRDEVKNVRENVGMIDVGTLGKIDVCGPDAAEFIERLYTMRYANLKVGMTRYVVMCDESGVVVDDGVAARMAEDRFYVTATTTGADGVYREMQRQAIIWKSRVTLINNTGIFGAMNLAGRHSRKILQSLTQVELSQEAFPYLGHREGLVAGVRARIMRVGFVGELGYEIHVPSNSAAHVWDAIIKAGEPHGIRPFGVEAQRILRLEKGHIIIGQDTDGLTSPFESGMEWAVKADKPFFIGQRSLSIVKRKPITRSLVGFALPQDYHGEIPKECHLVIRDGAIVGRVTSVTHSPTLGRIIGLAYVAPDQTQIGGTFVIRIDGGREIPAEVVRMPFYDPDNKRQTQSEGA